MKRVAVWLLLVVLLVVFTGCGEDGEMAATGGGGGSEKQLNVVGVNTSGADWVIEKTTYGSEMYRGEMDAIYAKDFVVPAGETFLTLSGTAESYAQSTAFTETSDSTYEYKIQLIAGGPMPTDPDEQYVYDPFVAVVDFVITGTYGEPVTIEWNGSTFTQVN